MRPLIAIVGSGDTGRQYSPPLQAGEDLPAACEDLGRELARAGFDLIVFSSDDDYLEKDVVRGFVDGPPAADQRVVVRGPARRPVAFEVPADLSDRLHIEPDASDLWEPSFYRSVMTAEGLVVIGGGRSARIAGTIAIAQRTPVVALAWFGAGAAVVWQHLDRTPNDVTRDELNVMANPWTATTASRLAASLRGQLDRRGEAERRQRLDSARFRRSRARTSLTAAAMLVLAALSLLVVWTHLTTGQAIGCLLLGAMFGAVGGALLRSTTEDRPDAVWTAARGLGAGLLAATLYVASQLLTFPDLLTLAAVRRLAWFVIPMGITAGYTFDLVYSRLRPANVVALDTIEVGQPRA